MRNEFLIKAWTPEEREQRVQGQTSRGMELVVEGQEYSHSGHRMIYWAKVRRKSGTENLDSERG